MNHSDRNWNNLFGEYTTDETAWYGQWNSYSPEQELIKSKQVIRSFRSNVDNTVITHTNRYLDNDGNVVDKTSWQIDRETCNQPNGVSHPAASSMRTLSFGAGATAWLSQKLSLGNACGLELFFGNHDWRSSVVIVYGENGQLDRITHIREHRGDFSDQFLSKELSELSGNWIGKKRCMTPDLSISSEEETQVSFDQTSDPDKIIRLPGNTIVKFSESVDVNQPIQLAAGHQVADDQLQFLAAHYDTTGSFTQLVSATLQS
ncbi:DUF3598 family protein [Phormidesmis sp. 146-33]